MLKTGAKDIKLAKDTEVYLQADHPFTIYIVNKKSEIIDLVPGSSGRKEFSFEVKDECIIRVQIDDLAHWTIDLKPRYVHNECPDPLPIEVPEELLRPPSLEQQIKTMVQAQMRLSNNEEKISFEEFDNLHVDEEPDLTSPYEFEEMPEDYLSLVEPETETSEPTNQPDQEETPKGEEAETITADPPPAAQNG